MNFKNRRAFFICVVIVIVIVIVAIVLQVRSKEQKEQEAWHDPFNNQSLEENKPEKEDLNSSVIVDVKGEVNKPGIYEMDVKDRIYDVIEKAGGLTKEANEQSVNLAQKVDDEMVIFVSKVGEEELFNHSTTGGDVTSSGGSQTDKININKATEEELQTLSGVGPAKAKAIIQYREENGPFKKPEDLMEVPGIGESTFGNMENEVQAP